jgi:oligopeptide/dipeptide ABC transporter ATP-binding protein
MSAVEVRNLRVELEGRGTDIVDQISLSIESGEVVGLVGESGSGKTTVGTALLGHARAGARLAGGEVLVDGVDLLALSPHELRRRRGPSIAYVPQDPAAALNPALRVGRQLTEMLEVHRLGETGSVRRERLREVFAEVDLPTDDDFLRRYAHQISGGQQQRIMIAMAFLLRPAVVVLDEPTTGLDVTTQAHVLNTVRELCAVHDVAALYISHDLAVVADLADRVMVIYAGRVAEVASRDQIFTRPAHPYTRRLLTAMPSVSERRGVVAIPGHAPSPGQRPPGCFFAPRCPHRLPICTEAPPPAQEVEPGHWARCVRAEELIGNAISPSVLSPHPASKKDRTPILSVRNLEAFHGTRPVLHGVSLELGPTECLALVGESGSGKTTLARAIVGLHARLRGEIRYRDEPVAVGARARPAEVRRTLQYVFQSPYRSLNPRRTVNDIVAVPLEQFFGQKGAAARQRVNEALERVALPRRVALAYPDQLSGGERQRVAIARALACEPEVLLCDEITSSLDVSVQAAIIELLAQLREQEALAMIFITHDIALVRTIADRVVVLHEGRVVESGDANAVLDLPDDPYTRQLIADTPSWKVAAR